MWPIILILSLFSLSDAADIGTEFITAFPENIAYYFPNDVTINLKITAMESSTNVYVTYNNVTQPYQMTQGNTLVVSLTNIEEYELGNSLQTVYITSNNNISVLAITMRGSSMQSNVVLPTTKLNNSYNIPYPNLTEITTLITSYASSTFSSTPLIFDFRLIVINAGNQTNNIHVTENDTTSNQKTTKDYTLGPLSMIQLRSNNPWLSVTADFKIAVLISNPCVDTQNCRCNMVMHQVRPSGSYGTEFVMPPIINSTFTRLSVTSDQSVTVTYDGHSTTVNTGSISPLPFYPSQSGSSPMITLSRPGSLTLVRPGLMFDLLPTSSFGGCFLVHSSSGLSGTVILIIAETATTNDVNVGVLSSPSWTDMTNTRYSWAKVSFTSSSKSSVIWHPRTKIAVYVFDKAPQGVYYGSPAIMINDNPDYTGCVAVPEVFEVVNDTMGWVQALTNCTARGKRLTTPSSLDAQNKMVQDLIASGYNDEVWIGLRRSLVHSSWYWQNAAFDFTNWATGQPDKSNGLCAYTSLNPSNNFTWGSARCCSPFKPLCYKAPVHLTTITNPTDFTYLTSWSTSTPQVESMFTI